MIFNKLTLQEKIKFVYFNNYRLILSTHAIFYGIRHQRTGNIQFRGQIKKTTTHGRTNYNHNHITTNTLPIIYSYNNIRRACLWRGKCHVISVQHSRYVWIVTASILVFHLPNLCPSPLPLGQYHWLARGLLGEAALRGLSGHSRKRSCGWAEGKSVRSDM